MLKLSSESFKPSTIAADDVPHALMLLNSKSSPLASVVLDIASLFAVVEVIQLRQTRIEKLQIHIPC